MATYDEVMQALRNADAAGDTAAATRLAQIAKTMQQPAQGVAARGPAGVPSTGSSMLEGAKALFQGPNVLQQMEASRHAAFTQPPFQAMQQIAQQPYMASGGVDTVPGVGGLARDLTQAQRILQSAQELRITPRLPMVSQSRTAGMVQQATKEMPIAGEMLVKNVRKTVAETGAAANRIAQGYGNVLSQRGAGQGVSAGLQQFGNETIREKAANLYDKYWSHFNPAEQIGMNQTEQALRLGGLYHNPQLSKAMGDSKLAQWADIIDQAGGTLSVNDARQFRTDIGAMRSQSYGPNTPDQRQLRQVYDALTGDLKVAAITKSDQALKDFTNADRWYSAALQRRDNLAKLADTTPENLFQTLTKMAQTKGAKADFKKLAQVRHSAGEQAWNDFVATAIDEAGKPTAGQASAMEHIPQFSPNNLVTWYEGLSPGGRRLLFDGTGKSGWAKAMDKLVEVADAQKEIEKLANTSGTTRAGIQIAAASGLVTAPVPTILTGLSAIGAEKLIMSPGFVRWLYSTPKGAPNALAIHVEGLKRLHLGDAALRLGYWIHQQQAAQEQQ